MNRRARVPGDVPAARRPPIITPEPLEAVSCDVRRAGPTGAEPIAGAVLAWVAGIGAVIALVTVAGWLLAPAGKALDDWSDKRQVQQMCADWRDAGKWDPAICS